jgi:crotonobetainyl-CoA:carnitine CoA-transferase CaiB-like acyl-CoA transferase
MNGALHGVRMIDMTRVWAGPHATRMLADMGAEVIHVTSRKLVGPLTVTQETARILGVYPDDEPGERHWNRNSQTNDLMRNKYDITLELDTPEGLSLLRRLIAISDVVVEELQPARHAQVWPGLSPPAGIEPPDHLVLDAGLRFPGTLPRLHLLRYERGPGSGTCQSDGLPR